MRLLFLLILVTLSSNLIAAQSLEELFQALDIAAYWDCKEKERLPLTYNHLLGAGYFTTPSARMSEDGQFGIGGSWAPPYQNWNGRLQLFWFLELGLNYRLFRGEKDAALNPFGFGDYVDRGANFKWALFTPEQSNYCLPGLAFGINDFMGSKKFRTYYIVGTQILREYGLELSAGWGAGTYTRGPSRGFFGGGNWFPFWSCRNGYVRGIGLCCEYDPTNYNEDPHPKGRSSHTPINAGVKYTLGDWFEASASCIRGEAFAGAASLHYNWGKTEGLLPKILDPLPYSGPLDQVPLGCSRTSTEMILNMDESLREQGFQLKDAWLSPGCLILEVINCRYRQEAEVRKRLQLLLAALTPANVDHVWVVLESYGLPCQRYYYQREWLLRYSEGSMTPYELDILTPRLDVGRYPPGQEAHLFSRPYERWRWQLSPRLETFWGSASGKFKYDLGLRLAVEGFLPRKWYYEAQGSYTLFSSLKGVGDFDVFYPSQLPNVATDYIRYRQIHTFNWDKLYLQKHWNFGSGVFGRVSGGYFQINYGGAAAEALWYPTRGRCAVGLEGALLKKRTYAGLGFQSTLRHFEGNTPVYEPYTLLEQYFVSFYIDFPGLSAYTKISGGQFLAGDRGVRLEATRYFQSGLRIKGWLTFTDAHDVIHGENYFDRGIAIELPFDFFYCSSSRRMWNYASAAWLRDAGYKSQTGKSLYDIINLERR